MCAWASTGAMSVPLNRDAPRFELLMSNAIEFDPAWNILPGHGYGLRGPLTIGSIEWPVDCGRNVVRLRSVLVEQAGAPEHEVAQCLANGFDIHAFLSLVRLLESLARSPVSQAGVLISTSRVGTHRQKHRVAVPFFEPEFTRAALHWLRDLLELAWASPTGLATSTRIREAHGQLQRARVRFDALLGQGVNNLRLATAASELGLPWRLLPGGYVHIGAGRESRLFSSTLTEATPAIGVRIARSKAQTAALLALGGLPVPRHFVVGSLDDALVAADRLGYPVVVKPEDRDGGAGVHAGLADATRLRKAYAHAAGLSNRVLVEEHVPGNDYRITVENGRIVKAITRQPGGVTGDGRQTVSELVADTISKAPPRRPRDSLVSLDEEARDLLEARGMTIDSIPEAGAFIALRRRANISTGGTSLDVIDKLHPDNASLAIRAAQVLKLDLAGIDLIMPDISRSWLDERAAICEVNAIPQLSTEFAPDAYRGLLERMIPGRGRLRTTLVIDLEHANGRDAYVEGLVDALTKQGERVFSVRSDGTWLGQARRGRVQATCFASARSAEFDPDASAAVVVLHADELMARGLPWLRIDEARVVGAAATASARLDEVCAMLHPHLERELVFD